MTTDADLQVFPNPALHATQVSYYVAQPGEVSITLRDALGREVRIIVNQTQTVGTFKSTISLSGLNAGVYYCVLHTASQHITKKIVVADH